MKSLTFAFLKIFFRNGRAIFFVIFLPAGLFALLAFLNLEAVIRVNLSVSYIEFLLTGMMAMALLQTGIYTTAYTLIDYKRDLTLKRLAMTPLSASKFLWAQVLARSLVAGVQVGLLLLIGTWFFGARIENVFYLPFLIFMGSTIFLNLGFLIAAFARDYEEAAPYTTIIGLVLVFLGNVFFPVENLPPKLVALANSLPLKPLSESIRHFLLESPQLNWTRDLEVLLIWFVVLSFISHFIFRKKAYK